MSARSTPAPSQPRRPALWPNRGAILSGNAVHGKSRRPAMCARPEPGVRGASAVKLSYAQFLAQNGHCASRSTGAQEQSRV